MDERRICALFARAPGLTARHVRAAVAAAGDLAGVMALLRTGGTGGAVTLPPRARAVLDSPPERLLDDDLRWLDASGAAAVPCTSPLYPPRLAEAAGAPAVLYVLGDQRAPSAPQVAMVGARRPTRGGLATAREIAAGLVRAGLAVTSGLAVGIDAASHASALDAGGLTLAVCAHGLDVLYPRQHRSLAERIRERGALISPFPAGAPPARWRFPWRNQVLSGLSLATLVVEAARRSGSLHTAHFALQHGRPVYAVPGSIRSPLSGGCHELLRRGARIAESASDILRDLEIPAPDQAPASAAATGGGTAPAAAPAAGPLDKGSEILLDALGFEPVSLNVLVERTGLPSSGIASMLLMLELAGRVAPLPGGRYSRLG